MIELALFSKWVRSGGYLVNLGKFWLAVLAVISSFSLSFLSFFSRVCGLEGEEGVCTFKTSPCVPAPRAHVEKHVDVVPVHTGTFWTYTRGGVSESTYGFFSVLCVSHTKHTPRPPTTPHRTHTHHRHHMHSHTHKTQHNITNNITRRHRQRETEKEGREREEKMKEERQDKTTEHKRRQDNTKEKREDRRLVFNVVVHGRSLLMECFVLLNPSTPESSANSVKSDSSLISFSAPWQVNSFWISSNFLFCAVTVFQNYLFMQLQFHPELILHMYSVEGYLANWIEFMENPWSSSGWSSQDSRQDSANDGRITLWSSGLQRQDHLHVNVQRHCMGCKRKWRIMWK